MSDVNSHSLGHTPHPTGTAAVSSAAMTPVTTAGSYACMDVLEQNDVQCYWYGPLPVVSATLA